MWVYRLGLERAKRYLLTGDEIPAPEAARIGLVLETVPDDTSNRTSGCPSPSRSGPVKLQLVADARSDDVVS